MISPCDDRCAPRDGGFTILELLVVLAIAGLIAAILIGGRPTTSGRVNAKAAAETLAAALREARSQAIAEGRTVAVSIDTATRTYGVGRAPDRMLPDGVRLALVTDRGDVTGPGRGRIRFLPDGRSTGGRIDITSTAGTAAVGIDWLSGRVTIVDAH